MLTILEKSVYCKKNTKKQMSWRKKSSCWLYTHNSDWQSGSCSTVSRKKVYEFCQTHNWFSIRECRRIVCSVQTLHFLCLWPAHKTVSQATAVRHNNGSRKFSRAMISWILMISQLRVKKRGIRIIVVSYKFLNFSSVM